MNREAAPTSPWPRRLRWLLSIALLASPPSLWFSSSDFRLVIYQAAYPYLDQGNKKWVFRRVRAVEERPDIAWRSFAEASEDPSSAWKEAAEACGSKGRFEIRGLESDLIRLLGDPRFSSIHGTVLQALIACRIKNPRLPPLLRSLLARDEIAIDAAYALVIQDLGEEALPVLIAALEPPPKKPAAAPDAAELQACRALDALEFLGPRAASALPRVRPWTEREDSFSQIFALAALRSIEGDAAHSERMKAMLASAKPGNSPDLMVRYRRLLCALFISQAGDGDGAVLAVLQENSDSQGFPVPKHLMVKHLGYLGAEGAPALAELEALLDDPDPALRDAVRQAIAAIENDRRGRRE